MTAKTVHVYPSNGTWTVKQEGKSAKTFSTQHEAVLAAKKIAKARKAAQLVVHGKNGQILEYEAHGMTRIQDPTEEKPHCRADRTICRQSGARTGAI